MDSKLQLTPIPDAFVIFVLGGPGAGKGTQCANLVKDYSFTHLAAGDCLRAERNRKDSPYGDLINSYIEKGQIVPMEITIALLHQEMVKAKTKRFLIDGFPRKMDQAIKFEEIVCGCNFVLYYECPEEELLKRLLKRGESSGRVDDNIDSIKLRFQTFKETSFPVIEFYEQQGKVRKVLLINKIDSTDTVERVYELTKDAVNAELEK
jgi:UMP-CMP kinase